MISRRTSSVPKQDVVFPRLLYCDSRCSQTCRRRSQVCCRHSQVLPGLSSALPGLSRALPGTLKAGRNALLGSETLLKSTHLSLHFTFSQTLLEASSDYNRFCWWLCNTTHRLGDGQLAILGQRVRGSVRAIRAIRNTRVFLKETTVVAVEYHSKGLCMDSCECFQLVV